MVIHLTDRSIEWSGCEVSPSEFEEDAEHFSSHRELNKFGLSALALNARFDQGVLKKQSERRSKRVPNGYWDDIDNVENTIRPIIDELGRFPTAGEISDRNTGSLLQVVAKKHGGLSAVATRMGYTCKKKQGYYSKWENVEIELQPVIDELGRLPTRKELKERGLGSIANAITAHGGSKTVSSRMGISSRNKSSDFWEKFDNVMAELQPVIDELGRFPSSTEINTRGLHSIVRAICTYHGGMFTVREKLGIVSTRKRSRYWCDWSNVEKELRQIIKELDHFPSEKELRAMGHKTLAHSIYKYHGGFPAAQKRLGFKIKRVPNGHWKDWENVKQVLTATIVETGSFPTQRQLTSNGFGSLTQAIAKYHGGMAAVRRRLGFKPAEAPKRHWHNLANVEAAVRSVIEETGEFPSIAELGRRGFAGMGDPIRKFHGGIISVRERMGYGKPSAKPSGYWKVWKNVEAELRKIISDTGDFPTNKKLTELGITSLIMAIGKYHDGMFAVRERMGYATDKTPFGYWKVWENVEAALQNLIDELGHFPTQKEIQRANGSISSAITNYHGGMDSVRARMGYSKIDRALLAKYSNLIASAYMQRAGASDSFEAFVFEIRKTCSTEHDLKEFLGAA